MPAAPCCKKGGGGVLIYVLGCRRQITSYQFTRGRGQRTLAQDCGRRKEKNIVVSRAEMISVTRGVSWRREKNPTNYHGVDVFLPPKVRIRKRAAAAPHSPGRYHDRRGCSPSPTITRRSPLLARRPHAPPPSTTQHPLPPSISRLALLPCLPLSPTDNAYGSDERHALARDYLQATRPNEEQSGPTR